MLTHELKQFLIEKGVKYCFANYVNIHGTCMGKVIPLEKFENLINGSLLFAGVHADGLGQQPHQIEVSAIADLNSLMIMPWRTEVVWVPCNLYRYGELHPQCSRFILKKIVEQAKRDFGISFNIGIEAEMYLLTPTNDNNVLPYFNHEPQIPAYNLIGTLGTFNFWDKIVQYMNELKWEVYTVTHEGGKSQIEFSFHYSDPITMADRFTFLRIMAKEIAKEMGVIATFMPKPFTDDLGTGAQFNISIVESNVPSSIISEHNDQLDLSPINYYFIGGILRHAKAITAVACPTVNSYKRLIARGFLPDISWAPTHISYGADNRTVMIRIVTKDKRMEYRVTDGSCNVYLALAMVLAAGLDGIKKGIAPGEPRTDNLYELSDEDVKTQKIESLPRTLLEAIECFETDYLSQDVFGDKLKSDFLKIKKAEWAEFYYQVSNWELKTYLEW